MLYKRTQQQYDDNLFVNFNIKSISTQLTVYSIFACVLRKTQTLAQWSVNNQKDTSCKYPVSGMKTLCKQDRLSIETFGKLSYSVRIDESMNDSFLCSTTRLKDSKLPSFIRKSSKTSSREDNVNLRDTLDSEENSKSFQGMCSVHNDKKSQYRVKKNGKYIQICKKCAVKFASRGIKTQFIVPQTEQDACPLDQRVKDKLLEKYIGRMEVDWMITKLKLLEQKLNDKKKFYGSILTSHKKNKDFLKALYQVLQRQLSKTWDLTLKQYDSQKSKSQHWRVTTIEAVVIIQKVIKDIQKRVLMLPFAEQSQQGSIQSCRFYKDSLIFHDHQCDQLDQQTQDLRINKQGQRCQQLKRFLKDKEAVLENIFAQLKTQKRQ